MRALFLLGLLALFLGFPAQMVIIALILIALVIVAALVTTTIEVGEAVAEGTRNWIKAKCPVLLLNVPMALWNAARGRPVTKPGSRR